MGLPSMPVFVAEYIADTTHLSCEESGAYLHLLMALWLRGGSIPDSDGDFAKITKLSLKKWKAMRHRIEPFFSVADGVWTQNRLTKEINYVRGTSKKKSAAGVKGNKVRWSEKQGVSDRTSDPVAIAPTPTPTPTQKKEKKGADKPAPPFDDFWKKVSEVWKGLNSPMGSKIEAEGVWKKLSTRERWIAYLVPDFYAAQVRGQWRDSFRPNAKYVIRYLRNRLFMEWEHECEEVAGDEAEANSGEGRGTGPDGGAGDVGDLFSEGSGTGGGERDDDP